MADELDPNLGEPGDVVVSTEDVADPEIIVTEEHAGEGEGESQPDPIANLATELGWVPKDQFRGSPDDWKPADEFIRAGRDIQRNLSRDLKDLKSTVTNMSRTSATLLEQQLERQRREIEAQFHEAVETGDTQAAKQLSTQMARLETQQQAQPVPTPEGQDFITRNSKWYGVDQEATNYALARADHYAKQGLAAARQLAAVEKDMREVFPDLFPAPAKAAAAVHKPASRAAASSTRTKGFHDLPPEAQAVAKDMEERLGIPRATYVTNYFAERKVG